MAIFDFTKFKIKEKEIGDEKQCFRLYRLFSSNASCINTWKHFGILVFRSNNFWKVREEGEVKKAIAFLAVVALLSGVSGAWAAGGSVTILGSYTDPITGQSTQFVNAKSNDAFRGNQTVIYAMTTDPVLVTAPNGKKRWENKTTMTAHDSASSTGIINGFTTGGLAGLFQGGGIAGGAALIRPSTVSQVGGGATQSQGQGQRQRQGQGQLQNQNQGQVNAPTTVNTNTNINTPVANAIQNQAQGQTTGPFSPVTAIAP